VIFFLESGTRTRKTRENSRNKITGEPGEVTGMYAVLWGVYGSSLSNPISLSVSVGSN
jgi:hypothetical protein